MEWRGRRGSSNIEDRRTSGASGGGRRVGGTGLGGGLGVLAIVVIGWYFGYDLTPLFNGGSTTTQSSGPLTEADQASGEFVSVTLADTEDIWTTLFQEQLGKTYHPTTLVLYRGVTQSPCGTASGATGPFYCPEDKKVYLDTAFFDTMAQELGAKGDFAMAYVVAHEVGHHVQDELGILSKANAVRAKVSEAESNAISVRIELQADCLAGIWGRDVQETFGTIEPGDFDEAINAAQRIGDDTLQRNAGRVPMPDSFTHGTSAQRSKWVQIGLKSGQLSDCDTFAANNP
ncbi:MAG: neutral zinc metallopeptidase [bacterium]